MYKEVEREVEVVKLAGLGALLGENVLILCMNYHYYGKLSGVNDTFVELENAHIVYETGAWDGNCWKDAQRLPGKIHGVERAAIESWCQVSR